MSVYTEPMRRVLRYYLVDFFCFFFFRFFSCKGLLAIPNTFHKYLPGIVALVDVVEVENLRVPERKSKIHVSNDFKGNTRKEQVTYIMIFQVSTGKSASLNDQSNFSWASGSSVGSW